MVAGQVVAEEVLAGVASLNFAYQLGGQAFGPVPFDPALDMGNVVAVNVTVVLDQAAFTSIELSDEQRTIEFLAAARNRL